MLTPDASKPYVLSAEIVPSELGDGWCAKAVEDLRAMGFGDGAARNGLFGLGDSPTEAITHLGETVWGWIKGPHSPYKTKAEFTSVAVLVTFNIEPTSEPTGVDTD